MHMQRNTGILISLAIICVACSLRAPHIVNPTSPTGRAITPSRGILGSTRTPTDTPKSTNVSYPLKTLSMTEIASQNFTSTNTMEPPCNSSLTSEKIIIKKSQKTGWCELEVPLRGYRTFGYRLIYPQEWSVRLAGAEAMNLLFNEGVLSGKNQQVFLQLTLTDLPLEKADQATYSFERLDPDPLVDPDELVKEKSIDTIGHKQALKLISIKENQALVRYFLRYKTTLYMFEIVTPLSDVNNDDYNKLLQSVEEMVGSMNFLD